MKEPTHSESKSTTSIADELGHFLDGQQSADPKLSDAFQRAVSEPPNDEDLHKAQLQTRVKIDSLDRVVRKLRRDVLITNCLLALMVLLCVSGAGVLYKRWPSIAQLGTSLATSSTTQRTDATPSSQPDRMLDFAEFVTTGEPLSPADLAFYPLILDLYRRTNGFRRNSEASNIDDRSVENDEYLRFLTDVTEVTELGAAERVSDELLGLVVKITQLAKQNRNQLGAPTMEADLLSEEIRSVLRDYSARARLPSPNPDKG